MTDKNKTIFLAAGGTGGHLFPAEALGVELSNRGYDIHLITDQRGGRFSGSLSDIPIHRIASGTFKAGIISKILTMIKLFIGFFESIFLLFKHRPAVVIGFGGYPSLPMMVAAQQLGRKNIVHEQNGVLGKANHFLSNRVTHIATSLPNVENIPKANEAKVVMTGNPVRPNVVEKSSTPYPAYNGKSPFHLFVTGGSQGARILSTVIPKAIALLPDELKKNLHITQQCRPEDLKSVEDQYKELNVDATLDHFFTNIVDLMASAHLIICRSGASTVAEIATMGRPAIFVPMKHGDNQQKINANALVKNNAGIMMEEDVFTPENLAGRLTNLINNPEQLTDMAMYAKKCGRIDAAAQLADLVETAIGGKQ